MLNMGLFSKSKVVIVEDNPALAEIYKVRLEIFGYKVLIAPDGEVALQLIEQEHPALVLMDLMIPKISGAEVLKQMRASEWGKDVKVQIISNINESDAPQGLRELGIEGYSVKANLRNDDLDNIVNNILEPPSSSSNQTIVG